MSIGPRLASKRWTRTRGHQAAAWADAAKVLECLPLDFHSTIRALAYTATDFEARFKLSLADAFAAALAKEKKTELVTGDPEFRLLDGR